MLTTRHFGSRLQGHPTPAIPWVDVATGSLGHGLPIAVGIALAGKYIDRLPYRTWVLLGDSETAEGSVWEAISLAGHYHLDNLTGIIDVNRLGQRGPTALGWDTRTYAERIAAFGWHTIEIDGHDPAAIDRAYSEAEQQDRPTMIIAKTLKGKGFSELENRDGSHGKALSEDQAERAIAELGGRRSIVAPPAKPATDGTHSAPRCLPLELPRYDVGDQVPTRQGYGDALKALGAACSQVVAVDAEVNNSTYSDAFANEFPDRFFEMYIAEQQMIGAAIGLSVRGYVPFASSFAAFLTRAYDFIRMAAVSRANIKLCGSHSGVSIGEDGPSQMGLEDLSMMRAVSGSVVLYPSDANQAARLVAEMADHHGISYLRTTREKTPVIYSPDETFPIGGSKVPRHSSGDQATVVAAGVTLHEALTAHAQLAAEGIAIRVIDAYSVKPIDAGTLRQAAAETAGRLVSRRGPLGRRRPRRRSSVSLRRRAGTLASRHQARRVRPTRIRQAGRNDRRRRHRQPQHRRRRQEPALTAAGPGRHSGFRRSPGDGLPSSPLNGRGLTQPTPRTPIRGQSVNPANRQAVVPRYRQAGRLVPPKAKVSVEAGFRTRLGWGILCTKKWELGPQTTEGRGPPASLTEHTRNLPTLPKLVRYTYALD